MESSDSEGVRFTKMHGAGNDYIYINGFQQPFMDYEALAKEMSDPHFGIGADGLVVILPSDTADFRMRMFNADGSEAEMCGNASRCIAKYVFDRHLTHESTITLETKAGIKTLYIKVEDKRVKEVTVDMGTPELSPELIPVKSKNQNCMIDEPVKVNNKIYRITAVSMGNPHAVVFTDLITDSMVVGDGRMLEVADIFPRKANIECARVVDNENIEMRVWERGTGETLACGTGACATAVAAVLNGLAHRTVNLILTGGILRIHWDEESNHVFMTGPAEFICDGVFYRPKKKGSLYADK